MYPRAFSTLVVIAVIIGLSACGRGNDTATGGAPSTVATVTTKAAPTTASFGDLRDVCGPGPAGTTLRATDTGVTAATIQVSAFSDVGFSGRPGLNQELF